MNKARRLYGMQELDLSIKSLNWQYCSRITFVSSVGNVALLALVSPCTRYFYGMLSKLSIDKAKLATLLTSALESKVGNTTHAYLNCTACA